MEDPSVIYEVEIASTARGQGILPPSTADPGKRGREETRVAELEHILQ